METTLNQLLDHIMELLIHLRFVQKCGFGLNMSFWKRLNLLHKGGNKWENLRQQCKWQGRVIEPELLQIEVLPPFWARLQFRYLLCVWGFRLKWRQILNVKHSHQIKNSNKKLSPLHHRFCCKSPRVPKQPRKSEFLKGAYKIFLYWSMKLKFSQMAFKLLVFERFIWYSRVSWRSWRSVTVHPFNNSPPFNWSQINDNLTKRSHLKNLIAWNWKPHWVNYRTALWSF